MSLRLVAGTANHALGVTLASRLGTELVSSELERFPDGELSPSVGPVCDDDVYVLQPTSPPVNDHLMELVLLLDACRRAGAARITAVVPYFGYARQDRRARPGQAIGAKVVAEMVAGAGADRLVVVDPHPAGFEALCPIPVEVLNAVPVLVGALDPDKLTSAVVVAPDQGAVAMAEHFAAAFDAPVAMVHKRRETATHVRAEGLVGEVKGREAIIVDDMVTTGGTVEAAARLLRSSGARPLMVVATHGLFVPPACERLDSLDLSGVFVTDTVAESAGVPRGLAVCSVASLLCDAIRDLHEGWPLGDLERSG